MHDGGQPSPCRTSLSITVVVLCVRARKDSELAWWDPDNR